MSRVCWVWHDPYILCLIILWYDCHTMICEAVTRPWQSESPRHPRYLARHPRYPARHPAPAPRPGHFTVQTTTSSHDKSQHPQVTAINKCLVGVVSSHNEASQIKDGPTSGLSGVVSTPPTPPPPEARRTTRQQPPYTYQPLCSPLYPLNTAPQQTRHIDPMLDQCWADVVDGGPTLVQHWVDVSCFLGPCTCWN